MTRERVHGEQQPAVPRPARRPPRIMTKIAYSAARVLVSADEAARAHSAVLVDGDRIVAVTGPREIPAEYARIDLGQVWLMPGLIDLHVHLVWDGSADPGLALREDSAELTTLKSAQRAQEHLRNGITTVRDCGAPHRVVLAVRDAIDTGVIAGARVLAAGELISKSDPGDGMSVTANGPGQVRSAVRKLLAAGADLIKVRATEGVFGEAEDLDRLQLSRSDLAAAVDEAHRGGRPVAAHAYSAQGIGNAIDAGADTLEHGSFLDERTARSAAAGGQTIVPTLIAYSRYLSLGTAVGVPACAVTKASRAYEAGLRAIAHARAHSIPIAAGSDAGGRAKAHGSLVHELDQLVKAGLSAAEAVAAATTVAARALRRDDLGALAPGRSADIIAVGADPTADIATLYHMDSVIAAGRPVKISGTVTCQ
jgi:imidazolonepropionase-like amidohydrolase